MSSELSRYLAARRSGEWGWYDKYIKSICDPIDWPYLSGFLSSLLDELLDSLPEYWVKASEASWLENESIKVSNRRYEAENAMLRGFLNDVVTAFGAAKLVLDPLMELKHPHSITQDRLVGKRLLAQCREQLERSSEALWPCWYDICKKYQAVIDETSKTGLLK